MDDVASIARGRAGARARAAREKGGMRESRPLAPNARDGSSRIGTTASTSASRPRASDGTGLGRGGTMAIALGVAAAVGGGVTATRRRLKTKTPSATERVLDRYAELIVEEYDIPLVPDYFEGDVYREVCKATYAAAKENMEMNLQGASVLGHPIVMEDTLATAHAPRKSGIRQSELKQFIDTAVGETSGIPFILPGSLERELYTNAVITGWTVFEDTLKTFHMQLFNREFVFDITDAEDMNASGTVRRGLTSSKTSVSGEKLDTMPQLSSATLRRIAREELEAPAFTNMFPQLQENVAKVAVGMLSQAMTMQMNIKGFSIDFALEPYSEDTKDAFKNVSFSEADREITAKSLEELFEVLVDEYMDTRAMAISSVFLPRVVERSTYINLLRGLFGELGREPVLENLGFNVAMRVQRVDTPASPELSYDDDSIIEEEMRGFDSLTKATTRGMPKSDVFKRMGDEMLSGDFTSFTNAAQSLLSGSARNVDGEDDARQAAKAERRRKQKATREAISEFVDYMLKDPMFNVKAVPDNIERLLYINCFELIVDVISTCLSDFELDMLGRRIRMQVKEGTHRDMRELVRFRPDVKALKTYTKPFEDLPGVEEIMSNVYAFVLAFVAVVASDFQLIVVGHKITMSLTTDADAMLMLSTEAAATDSLNESLVAAIEAFSMDVFAVSSRQNLGPSGNAKSGALLTDIDFDREVYALFGKYSSEPDKSFPFPYLNQMQFARAMDALVARLLPKLTKWDSREETVRKISKAADLNNDGVIQWAEWYYAAKAIDQAIRAASERAEGA